MRHNKGFSLVSLVIALGLVSIAGVLAIQYQLRQSRARLAQTWIEAQAREMDQIVAAVRTWTNTPGNTAAWVNDARTQISCDSLINSGLLPAAFGRDGVQCRSPFGTTYTMSGIKNFADLNVPQGRVRAIIYVSGTPPHSPGILRRAGIPNTGAGIQSIAMRVSGALADRKVPAGWILAGSTVATGVGRAWTKALGNWLGGAPSQATAVAFVGFPDLDATYVVQNPLPPFSSCRVIADFCAQTYDWGGCQLNYATVPNTCSSNEVQVKLFDACYPQPMEFVRGIGATVTGGYEESRTSPGRTQSECEQYRAAACFGNSDPSCPDQKYQECVGNPGSDVLGFTTISLNNERQLSTACVFANDTYSGQGPSAFLTTHTQSARQKNARICCTPF